ncbi:hypothetical protein DM47_2546 [Burkholderia mallei]|nr:hypothetical protein DM47_2546 [Burkholderia mallei]
MKRSGARALVRCRIRSVRHVTDDRGALHPAIARQVVHHRVVLRAAVVPDRDAVLPPAPAHLVLGDVRLAQQIAEQQRGAGIRVLPDAHARGRVVVREVRRERVDEQHLLACLRMRAHDRVLGVRELRLQCETPVDRHRRAEARLDAVARAQIGDLCLHVLGQVLVGEHHVRPHRIAADLRARDAAQHAAERRRLPPRRVGVPRVLVVLVRLLGRLVDPHEPGVIGIAAGNRVILQLAEAARERDVLGARDVLVAQEQHAVREQRRADLGEQVVVMGRVREAHADELRADRASQWLDAHVSLRRRRKSRSRWSGPLRDRGAPAPHRSVRSAD